MTVVHSIVVACDDCGTDLHFTEVSVREARAAMKGQGWRRLLSPSRDRCPDCVKRYGGLRSSKAHGGKPWGEALAMVLDEGHTIRHASRKCGLPYTTLRRRVAATRKARKQWQE